LTPLDPHVSSFLYCPGGEEGLKEREGDKLASRGVNLRYKINRLLTLEFPVFLYPVIQPRLNLAPIVITLTANPKLVRLRLQSGQNHFYLYHWQSADKCIKQNFFDIGQIPGIDQSTTGRPNTFSQTQTYKCQNLCYDSRKRY
jgi:hypothetical protein